MADPSNGDIHSAHLWFLLYLFLITLIALPILSRLIAGKGKKLIDRLARFTTKPGVIYLYVLPAVLISLVLGPISSRTYMFVVTGRTFSVF